MSAPENVRDGDPRVELSACGCCSSQESRPAGKAQGVPLRRCSVCRTLRFESIAPPGHVYRDGYHTGETDYGFNYSDSSHGEYQIAIADRTLEWIEQLHPAGRMIDVGGGLGYFAAAADRRGWKAELLDPVQHAVEFARESFGVEGTVGGADVLESRASTYDLVSFVHCIEHIPEARQTLQTATKALSPGGLLFVEVPNFGSMARRLQGEMWLGWQAGEHVYVFEKQTILSLIRLAGLEPVAHRTFVPGWSGLIPDGYAHFLGLQKVWYEWGGWLRDKLSKEAEEPLPREARYRAPRPISQHRGLRRLVYGSGMDMLSRIEESLGVGTNLQVLARPAA